MSWSLSVSSVKRDEIEVKLGEEIERAENFQYNPEGQATAKSLVPTALKLLENVANRNGQLVGVTMSGHTDTDGPMSVYVGAWLSG